MIQGCMAVVTRCRGVWAWLVRREDRVRDVEIYRESRLRDVELERARNEGTVSLVQALPDGGQVVEIEAGGRSRLISMPVRQIHPSLDGGDAHRQKPGLNDGSQRGELTS